MAAELSSRMQHIVEIFDSSMPIASSKLVYLSDLSSEELKFMGEIWADTDAARRQQVISQLSFYVSATQMKLLEYKQSLV